MPRETDGSDGSPNESISSAVFAFTNGKVGAIPGIPVEVTNTSPLRVQLRRTTDHEKDRELWELIQCAAEATSFSSYQAYVQERWHDWCKNHAEGANPGCEELYYGMEGYQRLRLITRCFLLEKLPKEICGERKQGESTQADDDNPGNNGASQKREGKPIVLVHYFADLAERVRKLEETCVLRFRPLFIELLWSYWQEQGMLMQTMNAILLRFQNRRNGQRDPLFNLAMDPLRPLSNLLWGIIQDTPNRLTVSRRAHEYDYEYGLSLEGRAVRGHAPVERRSNFVETFHHLLHRCTLFYKEADDTTIAADAFPLLNALRELQHVLSEGANNQYGDLPWMARQEMLMCQWILALPKMKLFLGGRESLIYREAWMDRVDAMRKLQGWGDTSVTQFNDLAVCGEQILLSVRHGLWHLLEDIDRASSWALFWRPQIQRYIHAYRVVTGVDLTVTSGLREPGPSRLIRERMAERMEMAV